MPASLGNLAKAMDSVIAPGRHVQHSAQPFGTALKPVQQNAHRTTDDFIALISAQAQIALVRGHDISGQIKDQHRIMSADRLHGPFQIVT